MALLAPEWILGWAVALYFSARRLAKTLRAVQLEMRESYSQGDNPSDALPERPDAENVKTIKILPGQGTEVQVDDPSEALPERHDSENVDTDKTRTDQALGAPTLTYPSGSGASAFVLCGDHVH